MKNSKNHNNKKAQVGMQPVLTVEYLHLPERANSVPKPNHASLPSVVAESKLQMKKLLLPKMSSHLSSRLNKG